MMRPYPASFIAGTTAFVSIKGAVMLTSIAARHSSTVSSGKRVDRANAALFTRMSTRPNRASVAATIASGTPSAATSPGIAIARSPSDCATDSRATRIAHVDRDGGPALVQALRDRAAKTASRARHDRDPPREIERANRRRARPAGCRHSGRTIISAASPTPLRRRHAATRRVAGAGPSRARRRRATRRDPQRRRRPSDS